MGAAKFSSYASKSLSRVLFGSQIAKREECNAQFATMSASCLGNLAVPSVLFSCMATVFGLYDLRHPFADLGAIQILVAFSNAITLLTLITSLSRKLGLSVIEGQRKASCSRCEFLAPVALCSLVSTFYIGALLFSFDVRILLASIGADSVFLFLLLSQREFGHSKSETLLLRTVPNCRIFLIEKLA